MSGEAYQRTQEKQQAACWVCGRLLGTGYHLTCHTCGATYCYTHMPERCPHTPRRQLATLPNEAPKA